jgi:hypothetical protein
MRRLVRCGTTQFRTRFWVALYSEENPKLDAAVESQVSKTARPGAPGNEAIAYVQTYISFVFCSLWRYGKMVQSEVFHREASYSLL